MDAQNLMRASGQYAGYMEELKAAHEVAVNSGNQFAEMVLFQMVVKSEQLRTELGRILDAVILTQHNIDESD